VSWNEEPGSWESTQDILEFLGFAGVDTTRDQLARLHRRRLINEPFHDPGGGRGSLARYPAARPNECCGFAAAHQQPSQLDELAWRTVVGGFRR